MGSKPSVDEALIRVVCDGDTTLPWIREMVTVEDMEKAAASTATQE